MSDNLREKIAGSISRAISDDVTAAECLAAADEVISSLGLRRMQLGPRHAKFILHQDVPGVHRYETAWEVG